MSASEMSVFPTVGLSRRDFVKAAAAVPVAAALPVFAAQDSNSTLGEWAEDAAGLPCFRYTGPMRFTVPQSTVHADYLPNDPYFLLGNYRLTLFAHASGIVQILSGERAWGRLNQGPSEFSGMNDASLTVGGEVVPLTGLDAPGAQKAEKTFGIGYATYGYRPVAEAQVVR